MDTYPRGRRLARLPPHALTGSLRRVGISRQRKNIGIAVHEAASKRTGHAALSNGIRAAPVHVRSVSARSATRDACEYVPEDLEEERRGEREEREVVIEEVRGHEEGRHARERPDATFVNRPARARSDAPPHRRHDERRAEHLPGDVGHAHERIGRDRQEKRRQARHPERAPRAKRDEVLRRREDPKPPADAVHPEHEEGDRPERRARRSPRRDRAPPSKGQKDQRRKQEQLRLEEPEREGRPRRRVAPPEGEVRAERPQEERDRRVLSAAEELDDRLARGQGDEEDDPVVPCDRRSQPTQRPPDRTRSPSDTAVHATVAHEYGSSANGA